MTARTTSRKSASSNVHHLRRGAEYRATTHNLIAIGEYLGMETPHGDRAILIRNSAGTESIALEELTSIQRIA